MVVVGRVKFKGERYKDGHIAVVVVGFLKVEAPIRKGLGHSWCLLRVVLLDSHWRTLLTRL